MPIQLPKIPCKICKDLFQPTKRGHTMYCSKKCTNAAGNARKKSKRLKFKKNIAILNAMKIPMGQIRTTSQAELECLGFDVDICSSSVPIWVEGNIQRGRKFYYNQYALVNQQGKITINH
jgi:hypothetical protein